MLTVRRATADDCRRYWEWANDPAVRHASFSQGAIPWAAHVEWFERQLQSTSTLFVVEDDAKRPIGQLRFDEHPSGDREVSVSLSADVRGHGLASEAIAVACHAFRQTQTAGNIVAHVRPDNAASLSAFQRAGFERRGHALIKGCDAVRLELAAGASLTR